MKNSIENPPFKFDFALYNIQEKLDYIMKYKEVDNKGRYLYWDKFKYRVDTQDDANIAWWATKVARLTSRKVIDYFSVDGDVFSFCMPDSIQAKLHKISQYTSNGLVPNNFIKNRYLISSLIEEEAISSSQLEGACTTRKVAKELILSGRKPRSEDEIMIINNFYLMKEIQFLKDEELSVDMLLELHKIATKDTFSNGNIAGEFRKSNDIVVTDGYNNIIHQPPEYSKLQERLMVVCNFANSQDSGVVFIHPIIKAIILHFMIGYEHPFADGNGRTARALFYWYMIKSGYDYFEYVSISNILKNAPSQYAKSYLYSEIDDNDLTYFIDYQLDVIIRAIDELMIYLEDKSREFEEISRLLAQSKIGDSLNFVQKDIIKKAIKNPGRIFTSKEIANDYDKSPNTARKYLSKLAEHKLLIPIKDGKETRYIAPSDIKRILYGA